MIHVRMNVFSQPCVKSKCLLQQTHYVEKNRLAQRRDQLLADVIEADSLIDLLFEEIDFELVIVADSLVASERMIRFTDEQSDESEQIIALRIDVIEADSLVAHERVDESIH